MTGPEAKAPPWVSEDWHQEVRAWIEGAVRAQGMAVVGPVAVIKEWALSCVIRVPTDGGAFFFKTSIDLPLFVNEAAVTEALARLAPEIVPMPLATEPSRNWLLLPDVGQPVGHEADLPLLSVCLSALAAGQVHLAGDPAALVSAGCIDRRGQVMGELFLELLGAPETAAALSAEDVAVLRRAKTRIVETIAEVSTGPIPPSLLHGDLHGGNVSVASRADESPSESTSDSDASLSVRFFDWTDAAVACPFFDPLDVFWGTDRHRSEALRDAFLGPWRAAYSADDVDRSWAMAERVVGAYHAVSYFGILRGVPTEDREHFTRAFEFWLKHLVAAFGSEGVQP